MRSLVTIHKANLLSSRLINCSAIFHCQSTSWHSSSQMTSAHKTACCVGPGGASPASIRAMCCYDDVVGLCSCRAELWLELHAVVDEIYYGLRCLPRRFYWSEESLLGGLLSGAQLPRNHSQGKHVSGGGAGVSQQLFRGTPGHGCSICVCKDVELL